MEGFNAIACDSCRSKKCKCDRRIPTCSQCQNFSLRCRYQEGGKRGLPAAYMAGLEQRLQETETALSATLFSLQDVNGFESLERHMINAGSTPSHTRSKAEKQDEWKRLPLQTSEHLKVWLRERHPYDESSEAGRPDSQMSDSDIRPRKVQRTTGGLHDDAPDITQRRAHTQPERILALESPIIEHLKNCNPPNAPNTSSRLSQVWAKRGLILRNFQGAFQIVQPRPSKQRTSIAILMEHEDDRFSPSDLRLEDERPAKRLRTSAQPAREVGLMRSIPGDKFTGFVGSASGIFFIRSVYGAIRPSYPLDLNQIETPGSDIVPGEDDHLPSILPDSSKRLWNDTEVTSRSISNVSFQDLVNWSGSFFANWHPAYPFIHAPAILEYLDELSRSGLPWDASSEDFQMIVVRSIMSISLADRRQSCNVDDTRYPIDLVFPSYDAAVDSLRHVLSRPTTIPALQTAISVQLFLISMLRLNAASRLGGLIIRMALQLGLHRCPSRYQSFSPSMRELRQRIFWSVYAIDRFICQSMGLPLGLHDNDVDVCYPITESHLENQTHKPDSRLRLLDLLARHAKMRGEIIELRNKSIHYVQKDPDRATAITAKLAQWWNDVEGINDNDDHPTPSAYHLTILKLLKHESVISLNRPTLAASRQGATHDAALQLCIGSARTIITTLHKAIDTRDAMGREVPSLTLLWPSCTWAVWISTFILFFAAHGKHLSQYTVIRLADRSLEILQHLSRRGSAWPEASAAAIRDLRAKLLNRDSAAQMRNQSASNEVFSNGDLAQSSSHGLSGPAPSLELGPAGSTTRHNLDHATSRPRSAFEPNIDITPDTRVQDNIYRDPVVSDLGNYDWNNFMYANDPIGQNTLFGEHNSLDPFSGFDIPFWFEQEQQRDILE